MAYDPNADYNQFDRGLPYSEIVEFNILESEFENGVKQYRDKWHTNRRRFEIVFKANTKAEIIDIRDFFINKEGKVTSFEFTEPLESTTYTVRFDENSFKVERLHHGVYNAKVTLVEVL